MLKWQKLIVLRMRFLICGAGRAGQDLHAASIRKTDGKIVGFVELDKHLGDKASARFNVPAFDDIQSAIQATRPDAVCICTSADSHFEIASAAIDHVNQFIIEKPLTSSVSELERLSELRKTSNIQVCTVHNHRFYKSYILARQLLKEMGKVVSIQRSMNFNYSQIRMMEPGHWAHSIPGGRLFEANPHNLYLIYSLIGPFEINSVLTSNSGIWDHVTCDSLLSTGVTQDGVSVSIEMSAKYANRNIKDDITTLVRCEDGCLLIGNSYLLKGSSIKTLKQIPLHSGLFSRAFSSMIMLHKSTIYEGSGHLPFYKAVINKWLTSGTVEAVSFEEAYFTQHTNAKMGLMAMEYSKA